MLIKLTDIGVRERFREDLGNIEELAHDFMENGQITPITVRKSSDDDRNGGFNEPYMLVAGGRRFMSASLLGWEEIKAETFDELPPLRRAIMELHENLLRKDLSWQEAVNLKAEIHRLRVEANPGQKKYETAAEIKDTGATFSRDMMLAEAIQANPSIAKAGSKKAAMRMVEMTAHVERVSKQTDDAANKLNAVKSVIHTADARDFLKTIEPGTVDLMYSDPLWGIDYFTQGQKDNADSHLSDYDDSEANMKDVMLTCLPQMIRCLKPEGWLALHCGYDAYTTWRKYVETYCLTHESYRNNPTGLESCAAKESGHGGDCHYLRPEPLPWIWHRPNSQNKSRYPDLHEDNRYEFLLVVNRGKAKLYRQHQGNVLVHNAEYGSRIHAMQKPIALCQDVISRLTLPRMLVVDPFFGSGALLAGAASLQRRYTGCDLNPSLLQPAVGFITQEAK